VFWTVCSDKGPFGFSDLDLFWFFLDFGFWSFFGFGFFFAINQLLTQKYTAQQYATIGVMLYFAFMVFTHCSENYVCLLSKMNEKGLVILRSFKVGTRVVIF
jgi:hypothetical protein